MKKAIGFILAALLTGAMFVGCGEKGFKDGTYKAKFQNASHGWTEYVTLTVSGGKISDVDFDATNENGDLKSQNQEYEDTMKGAGSTVGPMEFYEMYEKALIEKQDVNQVDAIATASTSGNSFKQLVNALSKNMATGNSEEVIVENEAE